jgi:hypothetical protein
MVYVYEDRAWDYHVVVRAAAGESLTEEELNKLGGEGWELTGVVTAADRVQFYFKRPRK